MRIWRTFTFGVLLLLLMGADGQPQPSNADAAVGLLREFGFPIFVSVWFMWRVEKRMDRFTEAIQNLLTAVTIQSKTIDNWSGRPSSQMRPLERPPDH